MPDSASNKTTVDATLVLTIPQSVQSLPWLLNDEHLAGLNALLIGRAVVELEKATRSRPIHKAIIYLAEPRRHAYDLVRLGALLSDLLIEIFARNVDIKFESVNIRAWRKLGTTQSPPHFSRVCLFSGGVDSFTGVLLTRRLLGPVLAVSCSHADQSKAIRLVQTIAEKHLQPRGVDLWTFPGPPLGASGYIQTRGFLYATGAAAWMQVINADELFITECGPTMFQPRFGPFDAVTMTTHPKIMAIAREVITLLLSRPIDLRTPFHDLTKAEVIAICPEPKGLLSTHSCVSQRFGGHDGTCYGCVIRRLAFLATGIRDVRYERNPLSDESAQAGNLLSLLVFSYDLLRSPERLRDYQMATILQYDKLKLFERFALDNFAALHVVRSRRRRLRKDVAALYREFVDRFGSDIILERLDYLSRARRGGGGGLLHADLKGLFARESFPGSRRARGRL